ncbi:uncharacterized protein N7515_006732 [Penicillium bovifimosum]|uniref:Uncharacterized protein n=1 Tax=Penicillium bovifimosum TaxID=126998 RepID=A0A9W9GVH1_9EURO|nr:uncharacterized protein N7515_006732 [Penicillium bovifimosum]KAJ5130693.1 hypothetical protein N7515_006732 [Penicillium bovifimosum]
MSFRERLSEGGGSPKMRKRKNRPSQAKRRRFRARLEASKMELEQALPKPTVPAASAQGTPLAASSSSTPLSISAPVYLPAHLAEQELHSGRLSLAPLPIKKDIDPPEDCGTGSQENDAPRRRDV